MGNLHVLTTSKIVELEWLILRSYHAIEAHDQEICDIMGGWDWSDFFPSESVL
jgi:hypothetical protein